MITKKTENNPIYSLPFTHLSLLHYLRNPSRAKSFRSLLILLSKINSVYFGVVRRGEFKKLK